LPSPPKAAEPSDPDSKRTVTMRNPD
jgi:hypothetical protein